MNTDPARGPGYNEVMVPGIPTLRDGLEAVVLDAGNTLICVDFEAIAGILRELGHGACAQDLGRAEYAGRRVVNDLVTGDPTSTDRSRGEAYFRRILEASDLPGPMMKTAWARLTEYNRDVGLWRWVREGTREALARLKAAGLSVGVVSNADGRVERRLTEVGLAPYLDYVIDSHTVGVEKPDPRIFRMALERTGTQPRLSLYAGDMYTVDVVGARGAGMPAVLMDPLLSDEATDVVRVRDMEELARLVLGE